MAAALTAGYREIQLAFTFLHIRARRGLQLKRLLHCGKTQH
jgi:hypothetical protein